MRSKGRGGPKFIGKSDEYSAWIEAAAWQIQSQRNGVSYDAPVCVQISAKRPTDRRSRLDLDNILKPTLDALEKGGAISNDRNVADIYLTWADPQNTGAIHILVTPKASIAPGRVAVTVRAAGITQQEDRG